MKNLIKCKILDIYHKYSVTLFNYHETDMA